LAVPISWKLLGTTAIVGAVAAVIAIIGLQRIQTVNRNLTQTVDFLATNVTEASLIKQHLVMATRAERNLILARSEDEAARSASVVDDVVAAMEERIDELLTLVTEEDQRRLSLFRENWAQWRKNHQDVRRVTAIDSHLAARTISADDAQPAIDRMESALDVISTRLERSLTTAKESGDYTVADAADAAKDLSRVSAVLQSMMKTQRAEKNLLLARTEEEIRQFEEILQQQQSMLARRIEDLSKLPGAADAPALADIRNAMKEYADAILRIRSTVGQRSNLLAYHFVYDIGAPIAAECETLLDGLIARNERQMLEHRFAGEQTYVSARNALLGISVLGILTSVAISFFTGHSLARRLGILSRFAKAIHRTNDLTIPTPHLGGDEVGTLAESFDQMRISLHERETHLKKQADRLAELTRTLKAKNKEMEQFVSTVSHDLKSPLVSCKGLLGLMREDVADQNYAAISESAERLDQAVDQLNQIIEDLLMLSRIGRKSLDLEVIDVEALLRELIEGLEDRSSDAQVVIEKHPPTTVADKSDLRRVFENLITNALKYGADANRLTVKVGGVIDSDEVRYYVRDNGPGIDPKYHERVFNLFQRLQTDQPGTGVGLASVAKIVSLHDGRVWVESELGEGATFWIAFPRRNVPVAAHHREMRVESKVRDQRTST
jgi:signal transduction histidine kinase